MCSVTCSPIDTLPVPASTGAPAAIEVAPNNLGAARRSSSPAAAGDSGDGYDTVRCSGPALMTRRDAIRGLAAGAAPFLGPRGTQAIAGHSREHLAIPCNLYPHPRLVTSYSRISCRIARLYPMEVVPYGFAFVI